MTLLIPPGSVVHHSVVGKTIFMDNSAKSNKSLEVLIERLDALKQKQSIMAGVLKDKVSKIGGQYPSIADGSVGPQESITPSCFVDAAHILLDDLFCESNKIQSSLERLDSIV